MRYKILLYLKGIAMGAADVVPGVSGGTIAFISGIYETLIAAIRSVDLVALRFLLKKQLPSFFKHINGAFLLTLFAGITTSIVVFSRVILYLLKNYPELLWSFFFGLIIASALLVSRQVKHWNIGMGIVLIIGFALAWYVSSISTIASGSESLPYIFFCGSIAITAMILPGISGSFILILLGVYETVIRTLKELIDGLLHFDWVVIREKFLPVLTFVLGCLMGLISFSHLLNWLFRKYHDLMITLLTGFMIGSLNKVWPWKQTLSTFTDRHGVIKPLAQTNISPHQYSELTGNENYLTGAVIVTIFGFILVYGLDKLGGRKSIKV